MEGASLDVSRFTACPPRCDLNKTRVFIDLLRYPAVMFARWIHCLRWLPRGLLLLAVLPLRAAVPVESWLTTDDLQQRISAQLPLVFAEASGTPPDRVEIEDATTFQTILGLGSSLEPTTCSNFWRMAPADRESLMERVVDPERGIGMNLMRLCIGTPDFTGDPWYSYCDLPSGQTDPELKLFSIDRDRAYLLPVIQLARRKNADLLFFASPWSPPGWMKSNGTLIGGHLLAQWYPVYARYFVRFIQAYEAEGIPIFAVTIQNEPGVDRATEKNPKWHYPSCRWTGEQERDFIRDHLGPALRQAGLKTKIWCYDHNYNVKRSQDDPGLDYPRTILRDARAAAFADGVAFHGYAGNPSGMSVFHEEFPSVPIHFSEGSVFGIPGALELIERLRHWAVSYNAWVLMLDDQGKPNNGPFAAKYATVALNTKTLKPDYLLDYHVYGQFMKFIPRGAVRVESRSLGQAPAQLVFRTPDGHLVLVAANPGPEERRFDLHWRGRACPVILPLKSVGTWRWSSAAQ
jgi:glucosylceramidase